MKLPSKVLNVLRSLGINSPVLLGYGGESYVFEYKKGTIVKIYTKEGITKKYLNDLASLQKILIKSNLSFATPEIYEIHTLDGVFYTLEKKLIGTSMVKKFRSLNSSEKLKLLNSYYRSIKSLQTVNFPNLNFGNILDKNTKIVANSWPEFLINKSRQRVMKAGKRLEKDVPDISIKLRQFAKIANKHLKISEKSLVHADYFVDQVLVNENCEISAVLDISYHAVVGDHKLDIASVPIFYGMEEYTEEFSQYLTKLVIADYGSDLVRYNAIYKMYYCFYISNIYSYKPDFYNYVVQNLNNKLLWQNLLNY